MIPNIIHIVIPIVTLLVVYYFLISEKVNKVLVTTIGATVLILSQVFAGEHSSQFVAFEFISNNLDVLGFVIGMMILISIIRQSGVFNALAIGIVKKIKGNPIMLLVIIGYMSYIFTILFSNIPTILILTPIIIILVRQLKLPDLPYFFIMVTMGNIGGAATPISDPTTYYQANTVGLTFLEVVSNSGFITFILSIVVTVFSVFMFKKELKNVEVDVKAVSQFKPMDAITDMKTAKIGVPILILAILLLVSKEYLKNNFGIAIDNASIVLFCSFILALILNIEVKDIFHKYIDWEIVFFFSGLFIIIGALEHNGIIKMFADFIISISNGNSYFLLFLTTVGSALLSVFIDNVPYNIAMVGAILSMQSAGVWVYPLWWGLNLGTSIGGAGSLIGAACNVVAFGLAEKEGFHTSFTHYLKLAVPLVILNSLIAFVLILTRYYL